MLPRCRVYHYPVPPHSAEDALWIERERRLLRIIINPTMILTWVLGLMLAFNLGWGGEGWLHAKLAIVLGLSGYHGRSEEHTSELQSLMRNSYAVFCLKKKNKRRQYINQQLKI